MPRGLVRPVDIDQLRRSGEAGSITFKVAAEDEGFRRWRPALVRGDRARSFVDTYFQAQAAMPWAGLITVPNATVIEDGLILQGDRLLLGASLMYPPVAFPYSHSSLSFEPEGDGAWSVDLPAERLTIRGRTASLVCDGWQIYGHWLVDVLPRLHRIMASGIVLDTYLFPGPVKVWQTKMLEAIGVDLAHCRFVDLSHTLVECDELVVATYDRYNSEIRPALVEFHQQLRRNFCAADTPPATRALFVSRGGWRGSRDLLNRGEVEAAFAESGFEIVRPETLSFPDQIRLFASAAIVAGECGSGLHNALFCGAGTKIGVIQSRTNFNFLQSQIGMVLEHELYYVVGDPDDAGNDGFSVNVQDVKYIAKTMRT